MIKEGIVVIDNINGPFSTDTDVRTSGTKSLLHLYRFFLFRFLNSRTSVKAIVFLLSGAWFTVEKKSFFMGTGRKSLLQIIAGDALDHYRTDDKVICASCNAGGMYVFVKRLLTKLICPLQPDILYLPNTEIYT